MPNETIVQYILNVDTDKAEKGLKETARDAKMTGEAFESMGNCASEMSTKLKTTEKQLKSTTSSARNLRRAGRDLDGALMDMAQGANLVSPAMGSLLMTMSNGASVADGLGRILLTGLNPVLGAVATITLTAGAAFTVFTNSKQKAEEQSKLLAEAAENTNEALQKQEDVTKKTSSAIAGYIQSLTDAKTDLMLLTGELSSFDVAMQNARETSEKFGRSLQMQIDQRISATEQSKSALEAEIKQNNIIINQQTQIQNKQQISAAERAAGAKLTNDQLDEETRRLIVQNNLREQTLEQINQTLESQKQQKREINSQQRELRLTLEETAKINKENKERLENERNFTKITAQREKEQRAQQNAAKRLQSIINKLTISELKGREKIIEQYNQELNIVFDLAEKSGEIEKAQQAEILLRERKLRLLEEQAQKEKEIEEQRKKEQQKQIESTLKGVAAIAAAPTLKGLLELGTKFGLVVSKQLTSGAGALLSVLGDGLGKTISSSLQGIGNISSSAGKVLGTVASAIPIIGAATLALGAIGKGLAKIGQKTPDERRKDLRQQAESMKKGLEFLPEILLQVLPQFALAIAEAIVDGFVLALQSFGDILRESLRLVFTREGRQERREANSGFLRDFFDPNESAAFAGGGHFIPKAEGGMRYTGSKRSGLAASRRICCATVRNEAANSRSPNVAL